MQSRSRTPLSANLERNLANYAIAAGAAGLGLVSVAQPAQAEVVYTPAHITIDDIQRRYFLDLNNDGIRDFDFLYSYGQVGSSYFVSVGVHGASSRPSNSVQLGKQGEGYANARKAGGKIGRKKKYSENRERMAEIIYIQGGTTQQIGSWLNVKDRYLGFRFKIGLETHYGWARLNIHFDSPRTIKATLTGYAYETTPNKPIVAGDEGTGASLGHLALGAANKRRVPMKVVK